MTIMKNPMILLGLVTMGIFLGMPYLVDNSESPPFFTHSFSLASPRIISLAFLT